MEQKHKLEWGTAIRRAAGVLIILAGILLAAGLCTASSAPNNPIPNIFEPHSTPADALLGLSNFVLAITGTIFVVVGSLLVYAVVKFRGKKGDTQREPAQV